MLLIEVNARHCFSDEDRRFLVSYFRPEYLPDTGVNIDSTEWSICFWIDRTTEQVKQLCEDTVHFIASRVRVWNEGYNADGSRPLLATFED